MAYTLNRRLAQLVDSNGQLNTGKIPNDYIDGNHIADNVITSAMLHTSFTVSTSNLTAIDTDDVSEGTTNLYFTNARADARIAAATTDDLTEGSTNLYYTTARWDTKMAAADTDDLSEGSTNLYFTNARIDSHLSGGTGVTYSSGAISIGQDVSTTATPTFGNITTTGYIAGPATFTIDPAAVGDNTGTVVIAGNLQVDGTTTTINSTTVNVDDLNIQLATGAINAAAADGAGITVDGASATITYDGTNDEWDFNKDISVVGINNLNTIDSSGSLTLTVDDADFIIADSTDTPANFIWRDHSDSKLYLGTSSAVATLRSTLDLNSNNITNAGTISSGAITSSGLLALTPTQSTIQLHSTGYKIKGGSGFGDIRIVAPRFRIYEDDETGTAEFQIDGGNATFTGTISSGAITSSASITASGNSNNFGNTTIAALLATSGTFSGSVTASGNSNSFGNSSFGTISSGAITSTGVIESSGGDSATSGQLLNLHGSSLNQTNSGTIRLTEGSYGTTPFFQGGFIRYDGASNVLKIGTHDASDNNLANDINAIIIARSTGKVGISTSEPLATLHVEGKAFIGEATPPYETEFPSSTASLHIHEVVNDESGVDLGNEAHVVISTGVNQTGAQGYQGSLWFGTSDYPAAGSPSGTGTQFVWRNAGIASSSGNEDTGGGTAYGDLQFFTNNGGGSGSRRMTITASGRVGIGTDDPDSLLDVNGVINIKSNPVIDSDGTSHYLKTPSGGAMYFFHGTTNMMYYSSSALLPGADNARNLGSTSLRWANIYTTDLHLSNEGKPEGNEVDGTTGNWTIQEGEDQLYIINNKNGKKYKFALEEIE